MRRRTFLASLVTAAALGLTGCTSSSGGPKSTDGAQTPVQMLAKSREVINATSGVHVDLVATGVPDGVNAIFSAKGDATPSVPAWKGNVDLRFSGANVQVPVTAIKDDMWAQIFGSLQKIDPKQFKVPNPASFFAKDGGVGSMLGKVQDAKFGDKKRAGKAIVQTITGTVPAADVNASLGLGATTGTYNLTFGVDESNNQLLTMKITGPFYDNATVSYDATFNSYGQTVDIQAP